MKFSINKNIILEQVANVSKAISTRNIIPILSGIKFDLEEDGLYLTASNSDLTIKSFIEKKDIDKVEELGTIIIPSKNLIDMIRKMPGETINFEVIDGLKIVIYNDENSDEEAKTEFTCLNSLDYPPIELKLKDDFITIKADVLKKMIKQTIFAISIQESRPLLTGINVKIFGDKLDFIATDSYRLAKKTIILDKEEKEVTNIVIPGKNINEFDHILSDGEDDVELHIFNNKILFKYKNILFQSNLLNGTYPNVDNLIPAEFDHIVNSNLTSFYNAIDRAALFTQSKDKNIVKMSLNESYLYISSYGLDGDIAGKSENKILVKRNKDDELDIAYSAKFMMDALKTFEDEEITIYLNSDIKPIVIKSPKEENLIQLIVPIKTY